MNTPASTNSHAATSFIASPPRQWNTLIRLTKEQFEQVYEQSQTLGMSIPELFRRSYFKRAPLRPMFDREGTRLVNLSLTKVMNLLNQCVARLNAGFREGFFAELDAARDDIRAMKNYLGGFYGNR